MVDASAKLEPSKLRPAIVPFWEFYAAVLHHHHHTEDTVAFPDLVAQRPEFAGLQGPCNRTSTRLRGSTIGHPGPAPDQLHRGN